MANELVQQCDIDIGIILFSSTDKPYSFFHPTVEVVAHRFLNLELSQTIRLVATHVRNKVIKINNLLEESETREELANKQTLQLDKVKKARKIGWWEHIEKFNGNDLIKFEAWLNAADFDMKYRLKQLENEASSSSQTSVENANDASNGS
ncbi:agamous-like MADS-box protein AGL61 [Lycium ferocissimum]|uniref:agamous-like MADS-box protein AGL61 n=1 Tax=Lycium ferocissimum TaxID=112874 RepID=UPI002815CEBA|nr:agamous-like MADS-box protein AGL61 [Lycium ferocissimum]